jgi:hypothetical protein
MHLLKRLLFFCFFSLAFITHTFAAYSPFPAADAQPEVAHKNNSQYVFHAYIKPTYADDTITFIKRMSENRLVIFDRKGLGELFQIKSDGHEYVSIQELGDVGSFAPRNVFEYQDQDKQKLLIVFNDGRETIAIYKLGESYASCKTLYLRHRFFLLQSPEGALVVAHKKKQRLFTDVINFQWSTLRNCYNLTKEMIMQPTYAEEWSFDITNESVDVVNADDIQRSRRQLRLSPDIFELDSIPKPAKEHVETVRLIGEIGNFTNEPRLRDIESYHKTSDGMLYCGQDCFVSVWSLKKE